jgi:lincosamide nucleotidyltransferase A/C/D/E
VGRSASQADMSRRDVIFEEAVQVLDALDGSRVRHWVGGGWGVDTLVGRQTREHRDLDLAVDADHLETCLRTLNDLGYVIDTDWLPARIELRRPSERWVDVHPVAFDDTGHGRQAGLDGAHFDYPSDAFTVGALNGRQISCLSVQQQRDFHTGYEHQAKDTHDLAQLNALDQP